jgi:hypothetical protein
MPVRFSDAEENRPFQEACEAVQRSAAGKDATQIRHMLTDEFRSRDIPVPPPVTGLIAASIASGSHDADDEPPFPGEPSWPGRAAGWVFRRLAGDDLTTKLISESPELSWLAELSGDAPDPGRYVPGPGTSPPPAQVILDPGLGDRMPWLFELPPLLPDFPPDTPRMRSGLRHARHPRSHREVSLTVRLEEDGDTVIVRHEPGRVGTLSANDTAAYLPHLNAARSQGKVLAAIATLRVTGRGSPRMTIRLGNFCA